ncbi:hypothetical protein MYAM1_000162 [Malassezia yamatoensis]|uniref:LIM zinc-binding domain-containing protein n=1 Tax=Malassezia yamatoensis TaxID=253288 RepID=A0AAJ5YQR3_9BASI|nr:hypothetical protein MYAM1_000162 [Malassezia yamatoensis]
MSTRSRPLPTPARHGRASTSAYDVIHQDHGTPPPVPPKSLHSSPTTPLSRSESLRRLADEVMGRDSPSPQYLRRSNSSLEKRPLPTPPQPLRSVQNLEMDRERYSAYKDMGPKTGSIVRATPPPDHSRVRSRPLPSPSVRELDRWSEPSYNSPSPRGPRRPESGARESLAKQLSEAASPTRNHDFEQKTKSQHSDLDRHSSSQSRSDILSEQSNKKAGPFTSPKIQSKAHSPANPYCRSPLRTVRPIATSDGVFNDPDKQTAPTGTASDAMAKQNAKHTNSARIPQRTNPSMQESSKLSHSENNLSSSNQLIRPPAPGTLAEPPRPETPTRTRTKEGMIPRIARTPSPVRCMRPYNMSPAVPGGPPVPLILIDGEEMTEAMMNPNQPDDATISFDDSTMPIAQQASLFEVPPTSHDLESATSSHQSISVQCHKCERGIHGATVRAMDTTWHARCFTCTRCSARLEHVSFYEHNGKPYCHLDYQELFARRCYYCQTPIVDERFVTVDDACLGQRSYHELHFFCAGCGDPFLDPKEPGSPLPDTTDNESLSEYGGRSFYVHGAHPYCEQVRCEY